MSDSNTDYVESTFDDLTEKPEERLQRMRVAFDTRALPHAGEVIQICGAAEREIRLLRQR